MGCAGPPNPSLGFFLGALCPPGTGRDGSVPRAPGLALAPPAPRVYQQEQLALALGLSQRSSLPQEPLCALPGAPGAAPALICPALLSCR